MEDQFAGRRGGSAFSTCLLASLQAESLRLRAKDAKPLAESDVVVPLVNGKTHVQMASDLSYLQQLQEGAYKVRC